MNVIITSPFPTEKASLLWGWMNADRNANLDDFGPKTLCMFKAELNRRVQYEKTYGVYLDDELVGYVGIVRQSLMTAFTHGILISPAHRSKGVGYAAMLLVLDELRKSGVRKVLAGFFADNYAIQRLFMRLGGHQEGLFTDVTMRGGETIDMKMWSIM